MKCDGLLSRHFAFAGGEDLVFHAGELAVVEKQVQAFLSALAFALAVTAGFAALALAAWRGEGSAKGPGRLQAAIETVLIMGPHMKSGALRGLGVTSAKRSAVFPDLPTIAEGGVADFQAIGCMAVFAAARTPPHIVKRLNAEIAAFMKEPELRASLLAQGAETVSGPPEILRRQLARDMKVWGDVIRETGLKAD